MGKGGQASNREPCAEVPTSRWTDERVLICRYMTDVTVRGIAEQVASNAVMRRWQDHLVAPRHRSDTKQPIPEHLHHRHFGMVWNVTG